MRSYAPQTQHTGRFSGFAHIGSRHTVSDTDPRRPVPLLICHCRPVKSINASAAAQEPQPTPKTAASMLTTPVVRSGDHVADLELPPGTMGLPIVGETFEWIGGQFDFYIKRREQWGNMYKSHVLFNPTVFIYGEDALKELFALEHKMVESSWPFTIQQLLGKGALAVQQFNKHTQQRRIFNQAFTKQAMQSYTPTVVSVVDGYVQRWVEAGQVKGYRQGKDMALDVAGAVLMGWKFEREELAEFRASYDQFVRGFLSLPFNLPWTRFGKGMQARAVLLDKIDVYIEAAMQEQAHAGKTGPTNTLDVLMSAVDEDGNKATREELKDQVLLSLFAGHETTATAVAFLLQLLTKHPDVVKRLREEQACIVQKHGREFTEEALEDMPYADAVVKETIRYRPPVPMVWRKALEDIEVNGYRIPKGWQIMLLLSSTARTIPEWIATADRFMPERWLVTDEEHGESLRKDPKGYMPFGDGARVCPGRGLANVELKVLLASLARRASFTMEDPDEPWMPIGGPVNGLALRFEPVKSHST